jgi:hypothetical protein
MTTDNIEKTYTLEDLNYFWTKSGVPCFIADHDKMEDIVESLGFNIYYLIANIAEDRKVDTKTYEKGVAITNTTWVTDLNTSIVKIVNNFVGRSVTAVKDEEIYDFDSVREGAVYSLPAIPRVIVDKLDEFFRLVETQHGTESIVMLTFDPAFEGSSEGWGILVPDQVNTSVHCKYDPDSIVDQKPENVMIVGSVHSHPNMAAYASGTDHADQADFDGLHITYGWQKSVNAGATQYHIEMQIGGTIWTLKPEDVFEDVIFTKAPDPEVIEWSQKVKKVLPPQGGSVTQVAQAPAQATQQAHQPTQLDSMPAGTINGDPRLQEYPDPKDENHLVIAEIVISDTTDDFECPSCGSDLSAYNPEFVCNTCDILLCLDSDIYSDILQSANKYIARRNLNSNLNIYIWTKDAHDNDILMKIRDESLTAVDDNDSPHTLIEDVDSDFSLNNTLLDEYFYEGFDHSRTVCCNETIATLRDGECECPNPVLYDQVIQFDQAHPYNVYDSNGLCADCEFYYSRSCTPYLVSILDYARSERPMQSQIKDCNDYVAYERAYDSIAYERD